MTYPFHKHELRNVVLVWHATCMKRGKQDGKTGIAIRKSEDGKQEAGNRQTARKATQRRNPAQETSIGEEPAYATGGQLKRDGT